MFGLIYLVVSPQTKKRPIWMFVDVFTTLLPFCDAIWLYSIVSFPGNEPMDLAIAIKCHPIVMLLTFVYYINWKYPNKKRTNYCRGILWGLIHSCFGDALLIWPDYFLYGMFFFAVAQIYYIKAFGFQTMHYFIAVPLFSICFFALSIILKEATMEFLIGVPIYSILLITMLWRATARVLPQGQESLSCDKIISFIAAIFFVVSDAIIGVDKFHTTIHHAQNKIMVTYYIAQFGMALSVVDFSLMFKRLRSHHD